MIEKAELRDKARLKGLHIGHAEQDYMLDLVLLSIARQTKDELIFKGGTALYKVYGLNRFSEDADFSAIRDIDSDMLARRLAKDLNAFGIENSITHESKFQTITFRLRCQGPLFNGNPLSMATVRVEINLTSSVDLAPVLHTFNPLYKEIPSFSLLVMQEKEILAEKIRAIMTRNKARDVYDTWFLLKKGIYVEQEIIDKKLAYYGLQFKKDAFIQAIQMKSSLWEQELKQLIGIVPPFDDVRHSIQEVFG